ncbi:MAG TPA: ABC transporter ATP-binding protein [Candidatus Eisenbacteria bacterium]|nr:ABC transporter ATP-binding protein [Candidatus Eisenbacteria bacterium]
MIRVEGVVKRYGTVTAVDGLTFDVARGETFALIGPNGAGKTTTLKLILGLARPDAGRIALGERGLPPHASDARRGMGYVPQRVEFPVGRSASEVLRFFAELRGLGRESVAAALDRVGMTALKHRRASELSGGYAQRLSLAQALLADPELLVLDEPTASLDPEATWEFRTLVEGLHREGKTILLCSHLLSEVERVADRVLILTHGRRAALESLAELRARQAGDTRLELETDGNAAHARDVLLRAGIPCNALGDHRLSVEGGNGNGVGALETLRGAGIAVRSFELTRPTLEEIFLRVVRGGRGDG